MNRPFPEWKGEDISVAVGLGTREDLSGGRFLMCVRSPQRLFAGVQAERADCRGAGLVEARRQKPRIWKMVACRPSLQEGNEFGFSNRDGKDVRTGCEDISLLLFPRPQC